MAENSVKISGATQVDLYLGNYAYADIVASMENLKMKIASDLKKICWKDSTGTTHKLLEDASGSGSLAVNTVLVANATGSATSGAKFTHNPSTGATAITGNLEVTGNINFSGDLAFTALTSGVHPVAGATGVLGDSKLSSTTTEMEFASVSDAQNYQLVLRNLDGTNIRTYLGQRLGDTHLSTNAWYDGTWHYDDVSKLGCNYLQVSGKHWFRHFLTGSVTPVPDLYIDGPNGLITAYHDMDVQGDLTIGANAISNDGTGGMSWDTSGNATQTGSGTSGDGEFAIDSALTTAKWRFSTSGAILYNADLLGNHDDTGAYAYKMQFTSGAGTSGFTLGSKQNADVAYSTLIRALGDETSGGYVRLGGDVDDAGYSEFETDGTLKFVGDATVYKDENFSGAVTAIGAGAPSLVNWDTSSIKIPAFPHNSTKELNFLVEYDHAGEEGREIVFHVHLYPTTASPSGTGKFFIEYYIKNDGSAAVSGTLNATYDFTGGTQWDEYRLSFAGITNSIVQQGTQIGARLYRDSTDAGTYANPIAVSTWGYHYALDTVGSRGITTK